MSDESAELPSHEELEAYYNSPEVQHGIALGKSVGSYQTSKEAVVAYDAGEIELWIELNRPRSSEDWKLWEAENGPISSFKDRWTRA